jgi:hypothetical protein
MRRMFGNLSIEWNGTRSACESKIDEISFVKVLKVVNVVCVVDDYIYLRQERFLLDSKLLAHIPEARETH